MAVRKEPVFAWTSFAPSVPQKRRRMVPSTHPMGNPSSQAGEGRQHVAGESDALARAEAVAAGEARAVVQHHAVGAEAGALGSASPALAARPPNRNHCAPSFHPRWRHSRSAMTLWLTLRRGMHATSSAMACPGSPDRRNDACRAKCPAR